MNFMFFNCESLQKIDSIKFNIEKVEDMSYLFEGCSSLISLDLSSLNTEKVKNMNEMFYGCKKLQFLDISHFTSSSRVNISMFSDLPEEGEIKVNEEFLDLIKEEIPGGWTIN